MSLPDVIEIVPPQSLIEATITIPGSKSITNRALVLAARGEGISIGRKVNRPNAAGMSAETVLLARTTADEPPSQYAGSP